MRQKKDAVRALSLEECLRIYQEITSEVPENPDHGSTSFLCEQLCHGIAHLLYPSCILISFSFLISFLISFYLSGIEMSNTHIVSLVILK